MPSPSEPPSEEALAAQSNCQDHPNPVPPLPAEETLAAQSSRQCHPDPVTRLPPPKGRNAHWRTFQFIMQNVFCFWLGYRAKGYEVLDDAGGGLVLANHQSFLDPLLIGLPLHRPISYVARDSLFRVPVIGWILRNTYVMPINREAASTASLRETIRRMEHGYLVGMFPEGTRTETGAVGPFKPGFVAMIRRSKLPVYPVGIAGAFQALERKSWFLRPARVRVVVGQPITVGEIEQFTGRDKDQALIDFVRNRIVACYEQAEAWRTGRLEEPEPEMTASKADPGT